MLANIRDVGRSQLRSWCPSNRNKDIAACKTPSTLSTRRLDNLSFIVFWFDSEVKVPEKQPQPSAKYYFNTHPIAQRGPEEIVADATLNPIPPFGPW